MALVNTGVVFGSRVYLNRLVQGRGPELAALADRLALRIASKLPAPPEQWRPALRPADAPPPGTPRG